MHTLLIAWVVLVGMALPVQAGMNAALRSHVGHPLLAALVNFVVGLSALTVAIVVLRVPLPSSDDLARTPLWQWCGGLIGATLVFTTVIAAPRLGAALLISGLLVGQLAASVCIDHFGWVQYAVRPVSVGRLLGVALLAAGVLLIEHG